MEKIVDNDKKYLMCSELTEGMTAERCAYLLRIKRKIDKNANPYLTFYFKTKDRVTLIGHKFKVADKTDSGVDILSLNRMMVRILFEVQIYNGSYTLLVNEVTSLPREDASPFFETYTSAESTFAKLNEIATRLEVNTLDYRIKTATLLGVQNGVTGAFVELADIVYSIITARKTVHTENITKCLFPVANTYFQYLVLIEKIEFLPKREILSLLQNAYVEGSEELTSVVMDTLSALMGQGKPEHLYAHILFNAFGTALSQMRNEELVKSSPKDLVISTETGNLIFY